LALSHPAKP
jgi:hypothetical protein